jgi:uncharacterized protein GlcG (DUF336 family)
MRDLTLAHAREIIAGALALGAALGLGPLTVVVLDGGGHVKACERQDGSSNLRFEVAHGKAYGALGLGMGSRALMTRAVEQPFFVAAVNGVFGGALVPVPGGVLVRDEDAGGVRGNRRGRLLGRDRLGPERGRRGLPPAVPSRRRREHA